MATEVVVVVVVGASAAIEVSYPSEGLFLRAADHSHSQTMRTTIAALSDGDMRSHSSCRFAGSF